jgi:FtsZ-binding cell division protein ZapB
MTMTWARPSLRRRVLAFAAVPLLVSAPAVSQENVEPAEGDPAAEQTETRALDEARAIRSRGNVEGVASQERIDELSDETETLFSRYSNTLRQIDALRVYNRQMQELISSQEAELASLAGQLDRVELVGRSVTPLMLRMIDALESLVDLDLPFLLDERMERVGELRRMMTRADVTRAEKFRRIMEAYQIENEFGRTIEAYRSTLQIGEREVTVDFLRFGRIALVYQTLDGAEAGVWDRETRSWEPLDGSYRTAIRDGLRIARKQSAPDLIRLPLPAPGEGTS